MTTLRPALPEDRFRLRRWLGDPALPHWWGPPGAVEAEIALAAESESALARIIEVDDAPVGYAHAVDASVWGSDLPPELRAGTWDIDTFVAPEAGRGARVTEAVRLLTAEVFATTLAIACCCLISIKNEPAARAYERAGFRWTRIWPDRVVGPCWVLERPR